MLFTSVSQVLHELTHSIIPRSLLACIAGSRVSCCQEEGKAKAAPCKSKTDMWRPKCKTTKCRHQSRACQMLILIRIHEWMWILSSCVVACDLPGAEDT